MEWIICHAWLVIWCLDIRELRNSSIIVIVVLYIDEEITLTSYYILFSSKEEKSRQGSLTTGQTGKKRGTACWSSCSLSCSTLCTVCGSHPLWRRTLSSKSGLCRLLLLLYGDQEFLFIWDYIWYYVSFYTCYGVHMNCGLAIPKYKKTFFFSY